jgi:hypothetical protein
VLPVTPCRWVPHLRKNVFIEGKGRDGWILRRRSRIINHLNPMQTSEGLDILFSEWLSFLSNLCHHSENRDFNGLILISVSKSDHNGFRMSMSTFEGHRRSSHMAHTGCPKSFQYWQMWAWVKKSKNAVIYYSG